MVWLRWQIPNSLNMIFGFDPKIVFIEEHLLGKVHLLNKSLYLGLVSVVVHRGYPKKKKGANFTPKNED